MKLKLQVEVAELDFISRRLTAGQMSFQEAMQAKSLLDNLVAQANDPAMQGRVEASPAPVPPAPGAEHSSPA